MVLSAGDSLLSGLHDLSARIASPLLKIIPHLGVIFCSQDANDRHIHSDTDVGNSQAVHVLSRLVVPPFRLLFRRRSKSYVCRPPSTFLAHMVDIYVDFSRNYYIIPCWLLQFFAKCDIIVV